MAEDPIPETAECPAGHGLVAVIGVITGSKPGHQIRILHLVCGDLVDEPDETG